jgi:hypothetical protein
MELFGKSTAECKAESLKPCLDFRGKDAEHEIMLSDPKAYRFRPVSLADLPRRRAWLQTPEVVRWWGDPAEQLEPIREDLKDPHGHVYRFVRRPALG